MISERLLRRLSQRYWRMTRALTMGAQGLVLDDSRRVLLVRHTYRSGWFFPGGGVECGETAEAALARELLEEAGIVMTQPPRLLGLYANFAWFPSDHVALFHLTGWRQDHIPAANSEIAERDFFACDALPAGTGAGTRRRIDEFLSGTAAAPHW